MSPPPSAIFCRSCKDIVTRLLDKKEISRLGSKSGASEVKQHKWFAKINWGLLRNTQPPVSPVPPPRTLFPDSQSPNICLCVFPVWACCTVPDTLLAVFGHGWESFCAASGPRFERRFDLASVRGVRALCTLQLTHAWTLRWTPQKGSARPSRLARGKVTCMSMRLCSFSGGLSTVLYAVLGAKSIRLLQRLRSSFPLLAASFVFSPLYALIAYPD